MVPHAHISIHAPLTGRDQRQREEAGGADGISIHAPRTGHDAALKQAQVRAEISIHVPRTGHDIYTLGFLLHDAKFQSTCPVRGTTAKMHK